MLTDRLTYTLTKEQIRAIPEDQLAESEKQYLIRKYCTLEGPSEMSRQLGSIKYEMRNKQRLRMLLGDDGGDVSSEPYRISADRIETVARKHPPTSQGTAVTDFTRWIYSLYRPAPSMRTLDEGKSAEKQIEREHRKPDYGGEPWAKGWRRIFRDPLDGTGQPLPISALKVGGRSLRGMPDLVFQEEGSGQIVIIERKATASPIPSDGWPNLRAQLWAYGHADKWQGAAGVTLIGEIWGRNGVRVYPRGAIRWEKSDSFFDEANHRLFELYGGTRGK